MSIRVAIVEDDALIRNYVEGTLRSMKSLEFAGAFGNAEDFMLEVDDIKPEVVLMDIELPGHSGIACIRHVKASHPKIQFVMFTVFENAEKIFEALSAGASGYLLKSTPSEKLVEAIHEVHDGGSPMSMPIARLVVGSFNKKYVESTLAEKLSLREKEVVELLAQGFMYKEIADRMKISMDTVRSYIRNIYDKLQVQSRTDAVKKVYGR